MEKASSLPQCAFGVEWNLMIPVAIIVPARLASTRFPRKLLHLIQGVPLLAHVARRLKREASDWPVWFAVDDPSLEAVAHAEGFPVVMTDPAHQSGTDRLAEANQTVQAEVVLNIQADEPLVSGEQIQKLHDILTEEHAMSTLVTPFRRPSDFLDANQVKCVRGVTGDALYFSRSPIPSVRDGLPPEGDSFWQAQPPLRHLGLYGYRAEFLEAFTRLAPGRLEGLEKLEQLRALENGYRIAVAETSAPSVGIDTPEDAEAFARYLEKTK
ncbi:MAG: 3-deoxy-manno-octulosonate cytidylyltransferase [Opitutales bacterium]|nr:3-deoxy-manno-octulosonate cytidylyltransferase [Opitutales bacterium]